MISLIIAGNVGKFIMVKLLSLGAVYGANNKADLR